MTAGRGSKKGAGDFGYDVFLSPFTWRYGSEEMKTLFSEEERRANWRKVWVALAKAEHDFGLLSSAEFEDVLAKSGREFIDIPRSREVETKIHHDLMAELNVFAAQSKKGGGKLHLGATSMDVEDNADILIYTKAIDIVSSRILDCLSALRDVIVRYRGLVCMAWTHLQPAEPTTLGYRFCVYAQDLVLDLKLLQAVKDTFLLGKGVKGAVGTSASYKALLGDDAKTRKLERSVMENLGLRSFEVAAQTYPRKVDFALLASLASVAQSCHKFGMDLRVLQSPVFGEVSEPFEKRQVGSSAMPFKRNPVFSERMCSLARFVSVLPGVAFSNAANSILERTLDDSASRRIAIPEAFLAVDECVQIYIRLARGLVVHPAMIRKNLEKFGPFAGTEAVLMKLAKEGGDRQKFHELIRVKSIAAWEEVMRGRPNTIETSLARDRRIASRISRGELKSLLDPRRHVGDAKARCDAFVRGTLDPLLERRTTEADSTRGR